MNLKKLSALILSATMVCSMAGCGESNTESNASSSKATSALKDGTYSATKRGHNGPVTLDVTVTDGKIADVAVVESHETKGIGDLAMNRVIDAAVENNSASIDTCTGATISSATTVQCLKDALKQAGADDDMFKGDKINVNNVLSEDSYDYDVVVIGAGGAGLTAAVSAVENGASVVVLEKTSQCGGNTLVSGGEFNIPCTDVQLKLAEEADDDKKALYEGDSVDLYAEDTLKGGDNLANPELVHTLAENALPSYEWLKDDVNLEIVPDELMHFGAHSKSRAIKTVSHSGYEMIHKLETAALDKGVAIEFNTKAVELMKNDEGEITGVKAENNGKEVTFNAKDGIVLGSGGFGANVEMRKKYNPDIDEKYKTTCIRAAQGDGIVMAEAVGADLVDMEQIQVYPICNVNTGIISFVADSRFDGALIVDQNGERIVNEMGRRDEISNAILGTEEKAAYVVWGQEIENASHMTERCADEFATLKEDGLLVEADTLEEAAAAMGINAKELEKTIDAWNDHVENGTEVEPVKRGAQVVIKEGPFYIEKAAPATHHTMGGVVINPEAEVISVDGEVIPHFFAAGEVTGGIHGTNRLGGNAITDCVVFGRIAGNNVVEDAE